MDHWFHERGMHRKICVFHISPTTDVIDKPFPAIVYIIYHCTTLLYVFLNTYLFFYLFSGSDTELFVHEIFCRDPMTVSSSFAFYTISTHRHPSRHHIFHRRLKQMPVVRVSTGEWRPIVKLETHMFRPSIYRLLERTMFTSIVQYIFCHEFRIHLPMLSYTKECFTK